MPLRLSATNSTTVLAASLATDAGIVGATCRARQRNTLTVETDAARRSRDSATVCAIRHSVAQDGATARVITAPLPARFAASTASVTTLRPTVGAAALVFTGATAANLAAATRRVVTDRHAGTRVLITRLALWTGHVGAEIDAFTGFRVL